MSDGTTRVVAQANAVGMLRAKKHYLVGSVAGADFFVVDGRAWMIQNNVAYRFDDTRDTDRIVRAFHTLSVYTRAI